MMPDPSPTLVSISTTAGPTSWTSLTYSDCSLNDDVVGLAAGAAALTPQAARATASSVAPARPTPRPLRLRSFDISLSSCVLLSTATDCQGAWITTNRSSEAPEGAT